MYLSKDQIEALSVALEAMENGGVYNEEQSKACDTVVKMLASARKEQRRRK